MSLRVWLLSRRLALRTVLVHDAVAGVLDDAGNLEELGGLELLHDVLQLRLLNQSGQLVEAFGARFDLFHRIVVLT